MNTRPNPEPIDEENPEWTAERVAGGVCFDDLPAALRTALRTRGRSKVPVVDQRSTIRVNTEVLAQAAADVKG